VLISGYAPELDPDHGFTLLQKPTSDEALVGALLEAHRQAQGRR
jgi:hypothetical protein